jgi:hypothetical protein
MTAHRLAILTMLSCTAPAQQASVEAEVIVPPPPSVSGATIADVSPVRHAAPWPSSQAEIDLDSTGIPECDLYIATLEVCSITHAEFGEGAKSLREAIRSIPRDDAATRSALRDACSSGRQGLAQVCK